MQGQHAFNPHARMVVDLESFVALDHFLRRVDRVMDFTFVRELTAPCYAVDGRPSIDPEVFFRMVVVGLLYGIASERRLCEEVQDNLAYRWFCRLSLDAHVTTEARHDKQCYLEQLERVRDRHQLIIVEALAGISRDLLVPSAATPAWSMWTSLTAAVYRPARHLCGLALTATRACLSNRRELALRPIAVGVVDRGAF